MIRHRRMLRRQSNRRQQRYKSQAKKLPSKIHCVYPFFFQLRVSVTCPNLEHSSLARCLTIQEQSTMIQKTAHPSAYASDAELAKSLQQFWPHRSHESGVFRSLLCFLGIHLWLQPDYSGIAPHRSIRFCHWCTTVEIDGTRYS